jgi:hypothetical protein
MQLKNLGVTKYKRRTEKKMKISRRKDKNQRNANDQGCNSFASFNHGRSELPFISLYPDKFPIF